MRKLLLLMALAFQLLNAQTVVTYTGNESTLNGQPFFVKGMYCSANPNLSKMKDLGVNVVMSYGTKNMDVTAATNFLNLAEQNGMYVLFQLSSTKVINKDVAYVTEMVNALKNHNALYAWYLFDEPSLYGLSPDDLEVSYGTIKSLDQNHPVFTSNWQIGNYQYTTDVDMRQVYQGVPSEMQAALDDGQGGGYIPTVDNLGVNWLPIVNTHASKFGDNVSDPVTFPSPAQWYKGVSQGSARYTELQNRAEDLNQSNVITNPFGKKDRYNVPFVKSNNFPDSEAKIRGQVACALYNKGNCIYWWLFDEGYRVNKRWGFYTAFHYEETKNSHKKVISEIDQFSDMIVGAKDIDLQYRRSGYLYRYIKSVDGKELVIIFDNNGVEKNVTVSLPANSASSFKNLADGNTYDIKTTGINLPKNGGLFLLNDPTATAVNDIKSDGTVLGRNYPNPFSAETVIPLNLQNATDIKLNIYDQAGRRVAKVADGYYAAGKHEFIWNGTFSSGQKASTGVYFCVLTSKMGKETLKMTVIK